MIEVIIIPMWRCAVCGLLYDGGEPFFGSSPSRRSVYVSKNKWGWPRLCRRQGTARIWMVNTTLPDRSG